MDVQPSHQVLAVDVEVDLGIRTGQGVTVYSVVGVPRTFAGPFCLGPPAAVISAARAVVSHRSGSPVAPVDLRPQRTPAA